MALTSGLPGMGSFFRPAGPRDPYIPVDFKNRVVPVEIRVRPRFTACRTSYQLSWSLDKLKPYFRAYIVS